MARQRQMSLPCGPVLSWLPHQHCNPEPWVVGLSQKGCFLGYFELLFVSFVALLFISRISAKKEKENVIGF